MAEMRCPMCGKNNPPEAEVCLYCQARLKPLVIKPPAIPPEDGGEADWLRQLIDENAPGESQPAVSPSTEGSVSPENPEGEQPDWLSRIRQRTRQEEDALSQIGPAPRIGEPQDSDNEGMPDWLRDLPLTGNDTTGIPAWMQELRPAGEEPPTAPTGAPLEAGPEGAVPAPEDNEAWLRSLGAWVDQGQPLKDTIPPEDEALAPSESMPAHPMPSEAVPDGLTELDTLSTTPTSDEQDNQEWLSTLSTLSGDTEPGPEGLLEDPSLARSSDLDSSGEQPDWLKSLVEAATPAGEETGQPPGFDEAVSTDSSQPATAFEESPGEKPPFIEISSTAVTGRLAALEQASIPPEDVLSVPPESNILQAVNAAVPPPAGPDTAGGSLTPPEDAGPDWLHGLSETGGTSSTQQAAGPEAEVPDWLASFGSEAETEEPSQAPFPAGTTDALPAEGLPEWLRAIEPQQPAPGTPAFSGATGTEPVGPFREEEVNDWVSSADQQPGKTENYELPAFTIETEGPGSGEALPAADGSAIPQWLAPDMPPSSPEQGKESREDLAPAEMPSWLQALRPVETAVESRTASLDEERIERTGPLAGMSGILPGEEAVTQYRKPPVFSSRLAITDKQQILAKLLESVVSGESDAQPAQAEPARSPQFIVRLLFGLVLISGIVLSLLVKPFVSLPKGQTALGSPAVQVFRLIEDLPASTPVLVITDYEAGLSGEMKIAALPIIQHLMARKTRIVLVSTQAIGPVLGENLLKEAAYPPRGNPIDFSIPQSSANLGYLVGGSMALRELASAMDANNPLPLQRAIPTPLRSQGGWDDPVLKNLVQITDFKRVILLTDSVETGRSWLEQVQPVLAKKVPFIVVSSAQSAPMLEPYQSSGQISVMISGLVGGRAYEEVSRRPATASAYWSAYQAGLALAILLVLLSGAFMSITASIKRSRQHNQARG